MDIQTIVIVLLVSIPAGFVIFFYFNYGFLCRDLRNYLETKYLELWKMWLESGEAQVLLYYDLGRVHGRSRDAITSAGPLAQLRILKFIEKQIPNDLSLKSKISQMRKTIYSGLTILLASLAAFLTFLVIKFLL